MNMGQEGRGSWKHISGSISFTESLTKNILKEQGVGGDAQASLRGVRGFTSGVLGMYLINIKLVIIIYLTFILYERFHKAKRKAEKEATATGTAIHDDLALMAIVAGGVSRECVYGVGLEVAHMRLESSRAHL
ncbi:hypothetical protein M9H77_31366 [Catharanthus roseus]|uniref:Uncharacterized protein n=1 Tax=Catharanthus roseus TaxID=4058 RepID=A0ACC0A1Y3_CATRO|nr:hypothetical protein M9H77_31366 [Catharanthus roseus]